MPHRLRGPHRDGQHTANPHVIVTKGTKAGRAPASAAYRSHVLDLFDESRALARKAIHALGETPGPRPNAP